MTACLGDGSELLYGCLGGGGGRALVCLIREGELLHDCLEGGASFSMAA